MPQDFLQGLQVVKLEFVDLRGHARFSVHFGHFLSHPVRLPLAADASKFAEVIKTEEKGSDVNLATHLLADGFRDEFDVAVVISNDSDLLEPIKVVRYDLKKIVGVVNPQMKSPPSKPLLQKWKPNEFAPRYKTGPTALWAFRRLPPGMAGANL